jgi:hypothetical protein
MPASISLQRCYSKPFPVLIPEIMKADEISHSHHASVARHRAKKALQGFVRIEVNVRKEDAVLVRQVAAALSDPIRQAATRMLLRQRFVEPATVSLKTLLASAPLEGIDLDRVRDFGRDVDL